MLSGLMQTRRMARALRRWWIPTLLVVAVVAGGVAFLLRLPAPSVDARQGTATLSAHGLSLTGPVRCDPGGDVEADVRGPDPGGLTSVTFRPQAGTDVHLRELGERSSEQTAPRIRSVTTSAGQTVLGLSGTVWPVEIRYTCSDGGAGIYAGRAVGRARPDLPLVVGFAVTDGGRALFHVRIAQDLAGRGAGVPVLVAEDGGLTALDASGRADVRLDLHRLEASGATSQVGSLAMTVSLDHQGGATGKLSVVSDALSWHEEIDFTASTGSATELGLPTIAPLGHNPARAADLTGDGALATAYPAAVGLDGASVRPAATHDELPAVTYVLPREDGTVDRGAVAAVPAGATLSFATTDGALTVATWYRQRLYALGWRSDDLSSLDGADLRLEMVRGGNSLFILRPGPATELQGALRGRGDVTAIDVTLERWGGTPVTAVPSPVGEEPSPLPLCVSPVAGASLSLSGAVAGSVTTTCSASIDRQAAQPPPGGVPSCAPPLAVDFVVGQDLYELRIDAAGGAVLVERTPAGVVTEVGSAPAGAAAVRADGGRAIVDVTASGHDGTVRITGSVPCAAVFAP